MNAVVCPIIRSTGAFVRVKGLLTDTRTSIAPFVESTFNNGSLSSNLLNISHFLLIATPTCLYQDKPSVILLKLVSQSLIFSKEVTAILRKDWCKHLCCHLRANLELSEIG